MQGLKPLALSSSSCASLNGKKIKFQVFRLSGEDGAVSSTGDAISWERIHRGLSETPPSHQSLGRPARR